MGFRQCEEEEEEKETIDQPEFQAQRACLGTFFFFIIHSLCLENQRKGNKQVFFFFLETQGL